MFFMKKILLFSFLLLGGIMVHAQGSSDPDQNPNYKASLEKYTGQQDKLVVAMNTTVQDTNKAYDWYEAKQERKQQRIADRRERRLYRLQNFGNFYNPYNSYNPYNRYNPYFYRF